MLKAWQSLEQVIKDHVATSLTIEAEDQDEVPFNQISGLGKAYELFGDRLPALLPELNGRRRELA